MWRLKELKMAGSGGGKTEQRWEGGGETGGVRGFLNVHWGRS
jgi:hypothetical protein